MSDKFSKSSFCAVGLMSGTSLDGIDLACVQFERGKEHQQWNYHLHSAHCEPYSDAWQGRLRNLDHASALTYAQTHVDLGVYMGAVTQAFLQKSNIQPDFIASHGHTIFHQPLKGLTTQIGSLPHLAAHTQCLTIGDFRTLDVALGGQGAPLVPIGDELLFGNYHFCLNIGGIANVSFNQQGKRIAYDICPANMVLNYLARSLAKPYDEDGNWAKQGSVDQELLAELNNLHFYQEQYPKSLGKEWIYETVIPLVEASTSSVYDKLRTVVEHMSVQIASSINGIEFPTAPTMLVTGGGAFNSFLIETLQNKTNVRLVVPDSKLVAFKEAVVFAFLGLMRFLEQPNSLCSVTGSRYNNIGGCIYIPYQTSNT